MNEAPDNLDVAKRGHIVFLVGFMGAGKTTVGRSLAARLGYEFLDLDSEIERFAGKTIREIFESEGEAVFRKIERQRIAALDSLRKTVVALGGGAYVSPENRATLRNLGPTIWLDCAFSLCISRIAADQSRPLFTSIDDARALYESRLPTYAKAELRIPVADESPEVIAERIARRLDVGC